MQRVSTVRRVDALFQAMASDFLLREQFVTDPTQILSEYVFGSSVPREQAAGSNQLIYAVFANSGMRKWLQDYCLRRRAVAPTPDEFVDEFSRAVVSAGARHVVTSLINASSTKSGLGGFHEDLLHWLATIGAHLGNRDGDGGTGDGGTGDGGTGDGGTGDGGTGDGGTGDGGTGDGGTGDGGTGDGGTGDGGTVATMTSITLTTFITTGDGGTRTGTGPFTQTGGGTRSPFTNEPPGTRGAFRPVFDAQFASRHVMVTLEALAHYAIGLERVGAFGLSVHESPGSTAE
jgi:hypothetical protein